MRQLAATGSALLLLSVATETILAFQEVTSIHRCRPTNCRKDSFVTYISSSSNDGAISKAYNDNALFNFHMMTQAQKIRDYSAMDTFVNTQSLWNLAWHESFVRNGLTDFVPPMTGELNVLVVGGRKQQLIDGDTNNEDALSGSSFAQKQDHTVDSLEQADTREHVQRESSCAFLAAVLDDKSSTGLSGDTKDNTDALEFVTYDCIMDEGLLADLVRGFTDKNLSNKTKQDVARLLFEATKRIREMGIYVANTSPMSTETKEYLLLLGDIIGLQWEFDLDGISNENTSVNVARKFGTCPTIGWQTMARMLEE
jgi:hypothetical protein